MQTAGEAQSKMESWFGHELTLYLVVLWSVIQILLGIIFQRSNKRQVQGNFLLLLETSPREVDMKTCIASPSSGGGLVLGQPSATTAVRAGPHPDHRLLLT